METTSAKEKVLKSNITKAMNDLKKGDILDKFKLEIYEKKSSDFNKECTDTFENIFESCDKKDLEKFITEQQPIQENMEKLWGI